MVFVVWDSLNADLSPAAKEQLLDGTLFSVTCAKCQKKSQVHYPLLYHDMKNKLMIQLALSDEDAEVFKEITSSKGDDPAASIIESMKDYKYRLVFDSDDLREKAMIFSHGFDDRVIEIMKLLASLVFEDKHPGSTVTTAFFYDKPEYMIQMFIKGGGIAEHTSIMSMYDDFKNQYQAMIEEKSKNRIVIDREWAESVMSNIS